jgi:hypothetical protein
MGIFIFRFSNFDSVHFGILRPFHLLKVQLDSHMSPFAQIRHSAVIFVKHNVIHIRHFLYKQARKI